MAPVHAPGYLGAGLLLFLFWSRQPDVDTYLARTVFVLAGLFVILFMACFVVGAIGNMLQASRDRKMK